MLRRSLVTFAAAAVAVLGAGSGFTQPAPIVRVEAPRTARKEQRRAKSSGSWWRHTYLNHGPTAAQVKRAAKKARNVKRHRQRVRG